MHATCSLERMCRGDNEREEKAAAWTRPLSSFVAPIVVEPVALGSSVRPLFPCLRSASANAGCASAASCCSSLSLFSSLCPRGPAVHVELLASDSDGRALLGADCIDRLDVDVRHSQQPASPSPSGRHRGEAEGGPEPEPEVELDDCRAERRVAGRRDHTRRDARRLAVITDAWLTSSLDWHGDGRARWNRVLTEGRRGGGDCRGGGCVVRVAVQLRSTQSRQLDGASSLHTAHTLR